MRVTFSRLPDHQWGHVLIERDDRVVYRMHAGPITAHVPHDLVHFTVEDALDIADGIWGAIAAGVVFRSMTHVSGRRPPRAAERSVELIRAYRDRLQRAELLGGLVESAAELPDVKLPDVKLPDVKLPDAELARLARQMFPGSRNDPSGADLPDTAALARAVAALREAQRRWRALPVGADLTLDWPAHRRLDPPPARRSRDRGRGRSRRSRTA